MDYLRRVIIGVGTAPRVVAAFRAFALYFLPVATQIAIGYLAGLTDARALHRNPAETG